MSVQLLGRDQIDVAYEEPQPNGYTKVTVIARTYANEIREQIDEVLDKFTHLRIYRVSLVHWILLLVWGGFLLSLTSVYGKLYSASALLATMCTNVLLFGISDIMAQGIHCYMSYAHDPLNGAIGVVRSIPVLGRRPSGVDGDTDNSEMEEGEAEEDNLSVFIDYGSPGANDSSRHPYDEEDAQETHIFDFYRWVCFMFWGFILSFFQVPWYKFLNYFYTEDPTIIQVFERVLSDQLLYSPISLCCFFMYSNYIMEYGDSKTFAKKIQRLYISTLGCNYVVWPVIQFMNFSVVPKPLQVPFSSSIGILWNCFLSMRNASSATV